MVLLILSKEYYLAVEHEIFELIAAGTEVAIVSAGLYTEIGSAHPAVREAVLPFSDKFKQADDYLNKTNVSLNARLATWLVQKHADRIREGVAAVRERIEEMERTLPEMKRREVVPMTDKEVLAFIHRHYVDQVSNATRLLRQLRQQEGKSCEQKRFGELFRQYKARHRGGLFDV